MTDHRVGDKPYREPCSHYREGDYGTRCKSGFVQSSACAGVGVVSLRDYPCCKVEFCGRIYADHGGKPPEHLIPLSGAELLAAARNALEEE